MPKSKLTEMVSPSVRPIHDEEGHVPFKPFTRVEWIVTVLLTLVCFGIPIGMVIRFQLEMARLQAAALADEKGGVACPYRVSSPAFVAPAGAPGLDGGSTARNVAPYGKRVSGE